MNEVMAQPILSTETGEVISALVVGFKPYEVVDKSEGTGLKSGIWVNGRLHLPSILKSTQLKIENDIARAISKADGAQNSFRSRLMAYHSFCFTNFSIPDRSSHPPMRSAFTRSLIQSRNSVG